MKLLQTLQGFLQRFIDQFDRHPDYARKIALLEPPVPAVLRLLDGLGVDLETVGIIVLRRPNKRLVDNPKFVMLDWVEGNLSGYDREYHLPRLVALTKVSVSLSDHPYYRKVDHPDYRERLKTLLLQRRAKSIMYWIQRGNFREIDNIIAEIDARTGRFALKDTSV
jgi:hypothetical protein